MIKVKTVREYYADSCSACWENKAKYYIEMGRKDPQSERFNGGSQRIRLCEKCAAEITTKFCELEATL
jgi:hypothetical protein